MNRNRDLEGSAKIPGQNMAAIRMPNQAKLKEHKAKMNRKLSVEDEEIKSPSRSQNPKTPKPQNPNSSS